ncbi:ornithine cyclodeaminase [Hydrogenophaga sp. IBVHS1]|uniref:ornithine cyclodeaminase n=1 Tax=Hydrogenophaga sp. IBVHS1 TaxID=1985169 RepID=UPI000A2E3E3E|nr:ornithine cyclodeaminase [Hydrogenophaga sp. IBVHS1]OSZ73520.1 ornithine cyclodeaminase [Hydrogenophaga sp. IBVHS1]
MKTSATSLPTLFLSAQDVATLVHRLGLPAALDRLAGTLHADYLRWKDFDKSARVASHSADGVIELMPIADDTTYAFKYVNGHPKNTQSGLPTVMAFGVLADVATGVPVLLSELTLTTALRTAAMSVVAARALARPNSRRMALIGNGAQSEFQALAFHHLMGIEEIRLYDTDAAATRKLMNNLRQTSLRLIPCESIAQAVRGADIVTTVTADKTNATILTPDMIEPSMHINGVGGDCPGKTELHPDVLRMASVFVEYEPQTRIEGDLQHLPADFAVTELWQVLAGNTAGRTSAEQVTLFDSVGFALEDYSALRFLREAAGELGLGQALPLIPALADPKDLFALLRVQTPTLALAA